MSTRQNQHVEEYLNAYRKMDDVDFAVMIKGSWGCGKTHFIKDYLKRECTKNDEKKYIYISLNGISSVADIDMALFQAAHPVLGSKLAVTAGKIFKASVKAGLKIDLDVNNDGTNDGKIAFDPMAGLSLAKFDLSSKGKLLVFDDIERCLLEPEEVLGYINAFVENREAKVILIGEEDHLNKVSEEKYRVIKEKVVGKTFALTESIEDILPALVTKKAYPKTEALILNNRTAVISIFKRVNNDLKGRHNYRALKHAFRDFEYFYSYLNEEYRKHGNFINDLLGVFVAFAYELQLKTITTDDIQMLNMPEYLFPREQKKEKTPLDRFVGRQGINRLNQVLPIDIWCSVLKNEPLDKEALFDVISSTDYFRTEEDSPAWKKLQSWWLLQDDVCSEAIMLVREDIKHKKFDTPQMILHVFGVMMELAASNLIDETKDDILQAGSKYVDALLEERSLELPDRKFDFDLMDGSMADRYAGHQYAEFKQLHEKVASGLRLARVEDQKSKVPDILTILKNDPDQFRKNIGFEGDWFNEPVLSLISPKAFYIALQQTSNHGILFVEDAFKRRYEFIDTFRGLLVELDFLKKLHELVNEDLSEHEGLKKPSTNALERMRTKLVELISLLERSLTPAVKPNEEIENAE